jgi:hypothetical protein
MILGGVGAGFAVGGLALAARPGAAALGYGLSLNGLAPSSIGFAVDESEYRKGQWAQYCDQTSTK